MSRTLSIAEQQLELARSDLAILEQRHNLLRAQLLKLITALRDRRTTTEDQSIIPTDITDGNLRDLVEYEMNLLKELPLFSELYSSLARYFGAAPNTNVMADAKHRLVSLYEQEMSKRYGNQPSISLWAVLKDLP